MSCYKDLLYSLPKQLLLCICNYCTYKTLIYKCLVLNKTLRQTLKSESSLWNVEEINNPIHLLYFLQHIVKYINEQQWRLKDCKKFFMEF
jgi:hypothetical protein